MVVYLLRTVGLGTEVVWGVAMMNLLDSILISVAISLQRQSKFVSVYYKLEFNHALTRFLVFDMFLIPYTLPSTLRR